MHGGFVYRNSPFSWHQILFGQSDFSVNSYPKKRKREFFPLSPLLQLFSRIFTWIKSDNHQNFPFFVASNVWNSFRNSSINSCPNIEKRDFFFPFIFSPAVGFSWISTWIKSDIYQNFPFLGHQISELFSNKSIIP